MLSTVPSIRGSKIDNCRSFDALPKRTFPVIESKIIINFLLAVNLRKNTALKKIFFKFFRSKMLNHQLVKEESKEFKMYQE